MPTLAAVIDRRTRQFVATLIGRDYEHARPATRHCLSHRRGIGADSVCIAEHDTERASETTGTVS